MLFTGPTASAASVTNDTVWFGNFYLENITGSRYISHGMQAFWATDGGQWIGAAYEIEGGTPVVPAPTNTEGVNFGQGVNVN